MPMLRNAAEGRSVTPRDVWGQGGDVVFSGQKVAGVTVNQDTGSRLGTAFSCIRTLAESMGSLPWAAYTRKADEREEVARPEWMDQPAPGMTRQEFVEAAIGSLQVDGNFYALIVRDQNGLPLWFVPVPPDQVSVRQEGGRIIYTVQGKDRGPFDVFHVPAFRFPGMLKGLSPIDYCRTTFGLAIAAEEFGAGFFQNGATVSGVLEFDGDPGETAMKRVAASWRRAHGGVKKSHLPGVLTNGGKWKPIAIPNDQAQFLETRKFSRSEIAGIYRVPPHMIGDLERATFSNIEHQGIDFVRYSLRPWMERLELRFNAFLPDGQFVKFNPDALMRGDTKHRYDAHSSGLQNGWLNVNEVRRTEDLPGIGPEGDVYMRQVNLAPADAKDKPDEGEE